MSHLGHHDVLRYLKREQTAEERLRVRDHLRRCDGCRSRVEQEEAFDDGVRRRLSYEEAPPHLIDAIRDGLERQARRTVGPRRVWVSTGTAAAAAVLALFLFVAPGSTGHLSEGLVAPGPAAGTIRQVTGRLVCFGCARAGVDVDDQRRCRGGHGDHVTGLEDREGRLWRFMQGDAVASLVADPGLRGRQVELSARSYDNIDYLRVYAARTL